MSGKKADLFYSRLNIFDLAIWEIEGFLRILDHVNIEKKLKQEGGKEMIVKLFCLFFPKILKVWPK